MTEQQPTPIITDAVSEKLTAEQMYEYAIKEAYLPPREGGSNTLPAMRKQLVAAIMSNDNAAIEEAKVHLSQSYEALLARQEDAARAAATAKAHQVSRLTKLLSRKAVPTRQEITAQRNETVAGYIADDTKGISAAITAMSTNSFFQR